MDDHHYNDDSKSKRPLPTPQRPNTPVNTTKSTGIPPQTFYGDPSKPKLPARPTGVGSGSTKYIAPLPAETPPAYGTLNAKLQQAKEDDVMMGYDGDARHREYLSVPWGTTSSVDWAQNVDLGPWDTPYTSSTEQDGNSIWRDDIHALSRNTLLMDGRDLDEETEWWNEEKLAHRPGQGFLAPVLAEELHDSDHGLFTVTAKQPEIALDPPPAPTAERAPSSSTSPPPANHAPPTDEEIRHAVPHPNAYYCPKDNGWVLLSWKSSSVVPPLARSFERSKKLPDQSRRKRTANCVGDMERDIGPSNITHHFHKYASAVDSLKLTVPYRPGEWETKAEVKQKRRAGTLLSGDFKLEDLKREGEKKEQEEEGVLMNLYMCCQCSFYCISSSSVIPGVVPGQLWARFIEEKKSNPPVGKSAEFSVHNALETILTAIKNNLWKGEKRMVRVDRPKFQNSVGWNPTSRAVFESLGFIHDNANEELTLRPPPTDLSTPQGRQNRAKLLRAWVEISAWLSEYIRSHATAFKGAPWVLKLSVTTDSAREEIQNAIGCHPDQMPRGLLNEAAMIATQSLPCWQLLGLTPTTFSAILVIFGYYANCRCHPSDTPFWYTQLCNLADALESISCCPQLLKDRVVMERSRGRFLLSDVSKAAETLGFGESGPLQVAYDPDLEDVFVLQAWQELSKRALRTNDVQLQQDGAEAFRILAQIRRSPPLVAKYNMLKGHVLNPDGAYDVLEVSKEVDDTMLMTVYEFRVDEQPLNIHKMREALTIIAESRDSERLRQYLRTGQDPGEIIPPVRQDWPRGLNQLGNTCYLNSLLQYLYTIKDLRDAVLRMGKLDVKTSEDDRLSDDDLKRHRVGGRLVTRREIIRSKRFISQLADLFSQLEFNEAAAVTPTVELAKLALVTSKDEEDDEASDKCGTDSSNDTDATLVDDGPSSRYSAPPAAPLAVPAASSISPRSPTRSPGSVLGKRPREGTTSASEMDVDSISNAPLSRETSAESMSTSPPQSNSPTPPATLDGNTEAGPSGSAKDKDGDVEMRSRSVSPMKRVPPPLPPRRQVEKSDSVMMFGKQHDVAECMDNCMFQIETAMLKFDAMSESTDEGSDKTSIVKQLFYGKIRQTLGVPSKDKEKGKAVEPKVDLFSHLPVNVAEDGFDLYDGLGRYFDDTVEFEGERVPMQLSLVDIPPLLHIQLQRVQFNRETLQSWKSQAYVKFGETIYMDRFMDNADPEKRARSKAIQQDLDSCRERINLLTRSKGGPVAEVLNHTRTFLTYHQEDVDLDLDEEIIFELDQERALVETEIEELRTRMIELKQNLEDMWKDDQQVAYELTSVFIHRGTSPSWGHYFFYSRHLPDHPDEWFKYNDSDVTTISKEEVFQDSTGSTANPYLLVFVRKGSEVVNTVQRFDPSAFIGEDEDDDDD